MVPMIHPHGMVWVVHLNKMVILDGIIASCGQFGWDGSDGSSGSANQQSPI
jgi:hypothetical protein